MKSISKFFKTSWPEILCLIVFFGAALYIRVGPPFHIVFSGSTVVYNRADANFFMRQVDNLVHNFPHLTLYDPYLSYPTGAYYNSPNLFVFLVSAIAWVLGAGHPAAHLVDTVGAYFPAVAGALIVIPVYFIGRTLFNRWAGLISAALIAISPGEFLGRSLLGATTRDSFEALLMTATMALLIPAVKTAREKQLTFSSLRPGHLSVYTRPIVYSLLSGLMLGLFVITWKGAFLVPLIFIGYYVVQSIIDHWQQKPSDDIAFAGIVTFAVAFIIFLTSLWSKTYLAALVIAIVAVLALWALGKLLARYTSRPLYYPASMVGASALGILVFFGADRTLFHSIMNQISIFVPSATNMTVSELRPILFPINGFTFATVWFNYTTDIILGLISLVVLIYLAIKRPAAASVLFLVWSIALLIANLDMIRMALLFAVNVALLAGYAGWHILKFTGLRETPPEPEPEMKTVRSAKKNRKGSVKKSRPVAYYNGSRRAYIGFGAVIVFLVALFPSISPSLTIASHPSPATPDANWYQALNWLKTNTPEPLGSPEAYYGLYEKPITYPSTAYSVTAWWDYGYWIMRLGRRLPSDDPGGGARVQVANLFLSQDEASANAIMDQLNSRYIILDGNTVTSMFYAILTYAGKDISQFTGVYYNPVNGQLVPVQYFYPAYYQSLAVRLYYFDGKAITPSSITVISWQPETSQQGIQYRQITGTQTFSTLAEANTYISSQKTGNYQIVSSSPSVSAVPLDSLGHYTQVFTTGQKPTPGTNAPIEIFQYKK